jgi:hypothetical protein
MTYDEAVKMLGRNRGGLVGSAQEVEGRGTKEENPHKYRLATYTTYRGEMSMVRHSPYVAAWIKKLEADDVSGDDVALSARLAALPEPAWKASLAAFRTHSQRMSAWFRELDKQQRPLTWQPTDYFERHPQAIGRWSDKCRQRVIQTALKRGDVVPALEMAGAA